MVGSICNHILLTGWPGVGKTTLIKNTCASLQSKQIPCDGFYTEEVLQNGFRTGFEVVTIKGKKRKLLASISELGSITEGPRVGRYVVDVQNFESTINSALSTADTSPSVIFIDEIGKMECFSKSFERKINKLFSKSSKSVIVATIPITHHIPVVQQICSLPNVELNTVTRGNRNILMDHLINSIEKSYNKLGKFA